MHLIKPRLDFYTKLESKLFRYIENDNKADIIIFNNLYENTNSNSFYMMLVRIELSRRVEYVF